MGRFRPAAPRDGVARAVHGVTVEMFNRLRKAVGWAKRSVPTAAWARRTDLGPARDRHHNMRRSGKPDLRAPLLTVLVRITPAFAAPAAEPIKLRIASVSVPPSMHTLFMHVAYEEGIYARNGLAVDGIVQLNSGPLAPQALSHGH